MNPSIMSLSLAALLTLPMAARSQQVYKCVDGSAASYQSVPCARGERLVRQWEAAPDPPPSREAIENQEEAKAQGKRESQYLRGLASRASTGPRRPRATGATISAARDGERCTSAKKRRDDTERRLGLKRTFETIQRLSRLVSEACR